MFDRWKKDIEALMQGYPDGAIKTYILDRVTELDRGGDLGSQIAFKDTIIRFGVLIEKYPLCAHHAALLYMAIIATRDSAVLVNNINRQTYQLNGAENHTRPIKHCTSLTKRLLEGQSLGYSEEERLRYVTALTVLVKKNTSQDVALTLEGLNKVSLAINGRPASPAAQALIQYLDNHRITAKDLQLEGNRLPDLKQILLDFFIKNPTAPYNKRGRLIPIQAAICDAIGFDYSRPKQGAAPPGVPVITCLPQKRPTSLEQLAKAGLSPEDIKALRAEEAEILAGRLPLDPAKPARRRNDDFTGDFTRDFTERYPTKPDNRAQRFLQWRERQQPRGTGNG